MHVTKDSSEEDYYDSEKMNITLTEIPRNFNFRYALLSQEFKGKNFQSYIRLAFMANVGE